MTSRYFPSSTKSASTRFCPLCGNRTNQLVCGRCQRIHNLPDDTPPAPTLTGTTSIQVRYPLYERTYLNQEYIVVWDGVRRPHPGSGAADGE